MADLAGRNSVGPRLRIVVFDIGNTIVNAERLITSSARYAAGELFRMGVVRDADALLRAYLASSKTLSHPHINRIFSDPAICLAALTAANASLADRDVYLFLTFFRKDLRRHVKRDDSLIRNLRLLKRHGLSLCALSDGTTIEQYELLDRLGVAELFDDIVISERFGEEKVSPAIFEHILDRFGVAAGEALMVGDDIRRDMFWAHRVGFITALQEQFVTQPANVIAEFSSVVDIRVSSVAEVCSLIVSGELDGLWRQRRLRATDG